MKSRETERVTDNIKPQLGTPDEQAKAFERIIRNDPEKVKAAVICERVEAAKERDNERNKDMLQKYRQTLENPSRPAKLFPHQVAWQLDLADFMVRAIQESPDFEISLTDLLNTISLGGFYSRKFIVPEAKAVWDDPRNWEWQSGYDHQDDYRKFTGPSWVEHAVLKASRLDEFAVRETFWSMIDQGYIELNESRRLKLPQKINLQ